MRRLTVMALIAASSVFAQTAVEDQIRAMEKQWAAAVVKKDAAALARVFSDQLIYAHSTGVIETKEQYVNRLKGGQQRYDAIEQESLRVVLYGDAAVAHSHVRMRGVSNSRPFNDYLMMMHVWVKRGGEWKLAAHQTTNLK